MGKLEDLIIYKEIKNIWSDKVGWMVYQTWSKRKGLVIGYSQDINFNRIDIKFENRVHNYVMPVNKFFNSQIKEEYEFLYDTKEKYKNEDIEWF